MNTPRDILNFVLDNEYEADFLNSVALHKNNYSIGEIADAVYKNRDGKVKLIAKSYNINLEIDDDEIKTAVINGLYVSTFVSRFNDSYQVHFLVHQYPRDMKSRFEEEIMRDVINYIILKTVIALRLDSEDKILKYLGK